MGQGRVIRSAKSTVLYYMLRYSELSNETREIKDQRR